MTWNVRVVVVIIIDYSNSLSLSQLLLLVYHIILPDYIQKWSQSDFKDCIYRLYIVIKQIRAELACVLLNKPDLLQLAILVDQRFDILSLDQAFRPVHVCVQLFCTFDSFRHYSLQLSKYLCPNLLGLLQLESRQPCMAKRVLCWHLSPKLLFDQSIALIDCFLQTVGRVFTSVELL